MERHRILPGISSTSIDSWDMENVKYLRKFSSGTTTPPTQFPAVGRQSETTEINQCGNDEQFLHYDETVVISANPNSREGRRLSVEEVIEVGIHSESNDLGKYSKALEPLDDCYLLDVVTVRNESVLTSRITPVSKPRLGSDGYETASSIGSSIDEQRSVFLPDTQASGDSGESFCEDYTGRPSFNPDISEQRPSSNCQRPTSSCPYCGELISITSYSTAYGEIYAGEIVKDNASEELSLQPMLIGGKDSAETSGNNSPYYVRLRRDLYLPPCNSPLLRTPNNFSVDQQGQLLIDYKANWDGLEKYIENLKLRK